MQILVQSLVECDRWGCWPEVAMAAQVDGSPALSVKDGFAVFQKCVGERHLICLLPIVTYSFLNHCWHMENPSGQMMTDER